MFVFLFYLCKKKRDSACVCVLIKELLLMFAEVMIFFEWVCSGDDFFDRWPGFQIGGVGF